MIEKSISFWIDFVLAKYNGKRYVFKGSQINAFIPTLHGWTYGTRVEYEYNHEGD